jgi:hypothetical protein
MVPHQASLSLLGLDEERTLIPQQFTSRKPNPTEVWMRRACRQRWQGRQGVRRIASRGREE